MYIGARYVPIFADPVEWDDEREYEPLTIVIYNGDCYTSKCYVPKGAQLPPYPDGQTKYWVKTSDYNYQFADLKKTVTDLSRLVEQFQKDNEKFTELINGWNETVKDWTAKMEEWQGQMNDFESRLTDLDTALNEEIARAKAAESANKAAIDAEVSRATDAEKALDTAYKAADAAIHEEFTAADTALSDRITANKTDIDALKAEQAIQNTNISNNAKNIADNSAEIAKHAKRLTDLESNASDWDTIFPDTTIAQEVQKEELARANADTALNGRCDAIAADVEEVRDIANHKVDTTTYTAGQAAQDAKITAAQTAADKANTTIGDWETDHPNQTISECATSIENEVAAVDAKADANAANIGDWNTEHPDKTISQAVTDVSNSIPDVSGFVTNDTYNAGQAAQNARISSCESQLNYKANKADIKDWVLTDTYNAGQAEQNDHIDIVDEQSRNCIVGFTSAQPVYAVFDPATTTITVSVINPLPAPSTESTPTAAFWRSISSSVDAIPLTKTETGTPFKITPSNDTSTYKCVVKGTECIITVPVTASTSAPSSRKTPILIYNFDTALNYIYVTFKITRTKKF